MTKKNKRILFRIVVSIILILILNLFDLNMPLKIGGYLFTYLLIAYDILLEAAVNISKGQVFDENFLMAVATLGAIGLGFYENKGDFNEAVAVMLFYQIGELFQRIAVSKSRKNISDLMDIRPDYANIEIDGRLERVDPDDLEVGSVIVVQPGEKLAIDGFVIEGNSAVNTSALTGESLPRQVGVGDAVISGSIVLNGVLKIKTSKEFGESTVSKILELVEDASSKKSKSEAFITKFARVYTPIVCYLALALALLPGLFSILTGNSPNWHIWIYRALTFLVISCPCALVISIPLSFFAGLGGASKQGILIKGSNYMETLANAGIIVFDKTGTLTRGVFEVVGVHHAEIDKDKLIEVAALAESASSHPISRSIKKAYGKNIDRSRVSDIEEIAGNGIRAKVDGKEIILGNEKLMEAMGISYKACDLVATIIHIAIDRTYAGHIVIADVEKESSKEAIFQLGKIGIKKSVMLTGDSKAVADFIGEKLGLDKVHSELLPTDKVDRIEDLLKDRVGSESLVFVGDGINDAPVLSRADVGVAMGAIGSDAAIEAADVVLMDDDPLKLVKAIKIARKCISIVKQNIWISLFIKIGCLILGALGFANMWLAIFSDVGVMVLAVLNATRALRVKNL